MDTKELQAAEQMESLVRRFVAFSEAILGDSLAGIYLHGSAVMGCWHPETSDLDLIVVVNGTVEDTVKRKYMDGIVALDAAGPAKGIEMSVVTRDVCDPFVYPTPFLLHYSRGHTGWYRRDPEDYIRKMNGTDRDLAAHFTVIRSRGRCVYGLPVRSVFGPVPEADYFDSLLYDVSGAEDEVTEHPMYLILNLSRVLAWRKEGSVLSKQEGGEWGLAHLPAKYHPLLRSALHEYAGGGSAAYDPALAREYAADLLARIRPAGGREPVSE